MARPRRLVLGLGNPLVGEDGFGGAVVEWLRRRSDLPADVDLVDAHTDLLAQVETLASYDEVVLVDVVVPAPGAKTPGEARRAASGEGDGRPGTVTVIDEGTFARWPENSPSCHQISPLLGVNLFRILYPEAATRIRLVALHADSLRIGPGVADSLVAAGGEAVVRLLI
ncbi:MAG: hydrogenase maturation protease [Acidobacteria bacterium]|nr:hydrogenase maturation protease [Acidobacteriota bacterium]